MLIKLPVKIFAAVILFLLFGIVFVACTAKEEEENTTAAPLLVSTTQQQDNADIGSSVTAPAESDSKKDSVDTYINLDNGNTTINGKGVSFNNGTLTITQSGTYSLKGELTDGKILVNITEEDKKVKLILNGVSISCSTDAPIYIENSPDETVIILASGSVNNLSDTSREIPSDESTDYATAVIYAKDDLQIEGNGTLNITANFNKGIFSKNDIDIRGGTINITSVDDGIRGKDSVEISDGIVNITCGGDGIRTSETEEADKGEIDISGGIINITADLDCIQAVSHINISGGTFNLVSDNGAVGTVNIQSGPGENKGGPGGRGEFFVPPGGGYGAYPPPDSSFNEAQSEDEPSRKGIKSDTFLNITAGSFVISSTDDTLHSPEINIDGGTFSLSSDDDAIHADEILTVNGGTIDIPISFEGIESKVININGGYITLISSDDGFNAAGGTASTDSGEAGFGMGGDPGGMGNPMEADYSCEINITDGYVFMNASGDGVDSNGNVNQSGGTVIVFGPTNSSNGALDYGGAYTISGGTLLATGAAGMAQSVTGDGVDVLAFTYSCQANVLNAILDENGNSLIGFCSPKSFGTVVFASDKVKENETYDVYSGGSYSTKGENGVYTDGEYTAGELVGSLDKHTQK